VSAPEWTQRLEAFLEDGNEPVSVEAIMCDLGGLPSRAIPSRKAVSRYLRGKGWRCQRDARGHLTWHRPPLVSPETWAHENEVHEGTILVADGGFTCIPEGKLLTVARKLHSEDLYVPCAEGNHMLDGQLDEAGRYVGLALARVLTAGAAA
jgi:hypothetical protein